MEDDLGMIQTNLATDQMLEPAEQEVEEKGTPKHEVVYYKWMSLSKDDDIIVNKDWVVCISDLLDTIKKSYEERMNGRDRSTNGSDGSATRRSESAGGTESDSGTVLNEQSEVGLTD